MSETTKNSQISAARAGARVDAAPLVSVVIPAYNSARSIGETLDSVLAQTFSPYEIIVVNDGSPDTNELEEALERYFDRIIYIKRANGGAAAARNTAIAAARGEFLAFLDGDDIWLPEYLDAQLKALKEKNCDLIYADALLFGSVAGESETYMTKSPSSGAVTTLSLLGGQCNVITSGTVARRDVVVAAGMFDEALPRISSEDFDLWLRLAKSGARLDYQRKVLLKYRVSATSLSGDNVQRADRTIAVFRTVEKKFDLTGDEREILQNQLRLAEADREIELGKYNLVHENFEQSRRHFREANKYYRKFKYTALGACLKISPALVLKFFVKKRPAEVALISPSEAKERL